MSKVVEVTYIELLKYMQRYIQGRYKTLTAFYEHKDYAKCGLVKGKSQKSSFITYLSQSEARVKSTPILIKLYKGLLSIELESKIEVIRSTKIFIPAQHKHKFDSIE